MEYGQTPWDNMTKEELKLEVFKLYKAAEEARSCLRILRCQDEDSPFWTKGMGFEAIDCTEQAMKTGLSLSEEDRETLWKGFFRNALPLLFNIPNWQWMVCEKCKQWSCNLDSKVDKCVRCDNEDLRPIRWSDFYAGEIPTQ